MHDEDYEDDYKECDKCAVELDEIGPEKWKCRVCKAIFETVLG